MDASLLRLVELLPDGPPSDPQPSGRRLVLTCEQRAKTRFRATLSDGSGAAVLLPRGSAMRPGARLVAETGEVVEVVAAAEQVYRVRPAMDSADPALDLQRAAYHLGNRHVPVELGVDFVKLERDPVLRDLLRRLGLDVVSAFESFDPEPGAYGGGHRHAGDDDADIDAGTTGEALSRDAHAAARARIASP